MNGFTRILIFSLLASLLPLAAIADVPLLKMSFNMMDTTCVVPLDTSNRHIYMEHDGQYRECAWWELHNVIIYFNNTTERPLQYEFKTFMGMNYDYVMTPLVDTLSLTYSLDNVNDTVLTFTDMYDSTLVTGIRVIDNPDGTESELTINLQGHMLSCMRSRFTFSADTVGDWLDFYPLAMGNAWRHHGPYPIAIMQRTEVIDTLSQADTTFYTIELQRLYNSEYGEGLLLDTTVAYTLENNKHQIFTAPGDPAYTFADFRPFGPYYDLTEHEGLMLNADGTTDYKWWQETGGAWTYRFGVGFSSSYGDGWGTLSSLSGYRVDGISYGNINTLVSASERISIPETYHLGAYPNPFNPSTTIIYDLPEQSRVTLRIYDVTGSEMVTLEDTEKPAGHYEIQWSGTDQSGNPVSTGVYFGRLEAGEFTETIKMVYLR